MNLLIVLGCVGGIIHLTDTIFTVIIGVIKAKRKYDIYKRAYEEQDNSEEKSTKKMGFKSKEERKEERIEALREKYIEDWEKIKLDVEDSGYFDMYWESNPVDNEFIEDDEDEDWEDKYPDLHIER